MTTEYTEVTEQARKEDNSTEYTEDSLEERNHEGTQVTPWFPFFFSDFRVFCGQIIANK